MSVTLSAPNINPVHFRPAQARSGKKPNKSDVNQGFLLKDNFCHVMKHGAKKLAIASVNTCFTQTKQFQPIFVLALPF